MNTSKNVWYDHGIGEGGGVIQFLCKYLESCGLGHAEVDAHRWLKNMFGGATFIAPVKTPAVLKDERKLIVTHEQKIEHPALIQYLESRGIPLNLAEPHLKQVKAYNKESKKSIFALGFKNEKGGWELKKTLRINR